MAEWQTQGTQKAKPPSSPKRLTSLKNLHSSSENSKIFICISIRLFSLFWRFFREVCHDFVTFFWPILSPNPAISTLKDLSWPKAVEVLSFQIKFPGIHSYLSWLILNRGGTGSLYIHPPLRSHRAAFIKRPCPKNSLGKKSLPPLDLYLLKSPKKIGGIYL